MFDMIESALATRTVGEPSSPLVVSVPHAGLQSAGFERTLTPSWTSAATPICSSTACIESGTRTGPKCPSRRRRRASSAT